MSEGDGSKIIVQSETYFSIGEGQKSDREDVLVVYGTDRSTGERWSTDHLGCRFLDCRDFAFCESLKVYQHREPSDLACNFSSRRK